MHILILVEYFLKEKSHLKRSMYLVNTAAISRNISLIVIIMNQRKFLDIPRCATKNSPSDFKPVVISLKDQKNIYLGNKTLKSQRPQVKTFLRISLFSLFCPSKFYDNHDAIFDAIVSNSCQSHCKYIQ